MAAMLASSGTAVAAPPKPFARADGVVGDPPWWLLEPLEPGVVLAEGWAIADLGPVERGATVLLLEHESLEPLEVHLCAHYGRPRGLVHTDVLDLIVMDGGDGHRQTDPDVARALRVLARVLRANELEDDADIELLADLLSHRERTAIYGVDDL